MRIHYLQHVPFEGLARIDDWCRSRGFAVTGTRLYAGDPLPSVAAIDWLIVMGGPMGANDDDRYLWLADEKRVIDQAIRQGRVVLGICLGAQLIAQVLGARVFPNPHKEIGWFPIELTAEGQQSPLFGFLPRQFPVFQWHGDTFDLPHGAVHLASSEACHHQAFAYDHRVVGLQFHLEVTAESVQALIHHCADELGGPVPGPFVQRPDEMVQRQSEFAFVNGAMDELLNRMARLTVPDGLSA
ncbi:MAG: type 1 glutamine amidotransferase [Chloroflexaceae bacterium]|nr:type 1 glutamine amidotransferase [Chloroflexaceae bacterium]